MKAAWRAAARLVAGIGLVACAIVSLPGEAHATTINVGGGCTLPEAVTSFNDRAFDPGSTPQPGCIFINDGQTARTVKLPSGTIVVVAPIEVLVTMAIIGNGVTATTLATTPQYAFVVVGSPLPNPTLTLQNLTLRKANPTTTATTGVLVDGLGGPAHLVLDQARVANYTEEAILLEGAPDGGFGAVDVAVLDSSIENSALAGIEAIDADVFISGSTISGNEDSGVRATFTNPELRVEIIESTISDNQGDDGGGVFLQSNTGDAFPAVMEIHDSTITGNQATGGGGGVFITDSRSTIHGTVVSGNTAAGDGGGILFSVVDVSAGFELADSSVTDNQATGGNGGGMAFLNDPNQSFANVDRCLFANNVASGDGGGIYSGGQLASCDNSTIDGNSAARGGGLFHLGLGEMHVEFSTITDNTASVEAGGVRLTPTNPLFGGNLIAMNHAPTAPDVLFTTAHVFGDNLIGDNTGAELNLPGDINIVGVDPLLGPLQNVGGPTAVRPLLAGSPAIDALELSFEVEDQRGVPRPQGGGFDIGAFEGSCDLLEDELVTNQGFESSTAGWVGSFGTSISSSTLQAHSGARSLRIANRNLGTWQGAEYDLLGLAVPRETLHANLWARVAGTSSDLVLFTLRSICQGDPGPTFTTVASATATNTAWVELEGSVDIPDCTLTELVVYAEGPQPGVVLYIDDVSVARQSVLCDGAGQPLMGSFIVTTDWGTGYCVELQVTNPSTVATTDWSATFNLNGTQISTIWNLGFMGTTSVVTADPQAPWSMVIPAGGTSHSLGFCADRPGGGSNLPTGLTVTGVF